MQFLLWFLVCDASYILQVFNWLKFQQDPVECVESALHSKTSNFRHQTLDLMFMVV